MPQVFVCDILCLENALGFMKEAVHLLSFGENRNINPVCLEYIQSKKGCPVFPVSPVIKDNTLDKSSQKSEWNIYNTQYCLR